MLFLTGGKVFPCNNLKGTVFKDILEIDNIIGVKTALNSTENFKKTNPTYQQLKQLTQEVFNAGLQAKKLVQVHIHLESLKQKNSVDKFIEDINLGDFDNFNWLDKICEETGIPYSIFKLTHAQNGYKRILEYANKGCFIDYTAFDKNYDTRYDDLVSAIKNKSIDMSKISISSDLGILSTEKGKETPNTLLHTIKTLINQKNLNFADVLPLITKNAGSIIGKDYGEIKENKPCKMLIINENLEIETILNENKLIKLRREN